MTASNSPSTPVGINHLVLNVRDLEESHRFWTEVAGFRQVGELKARPDRPTPPRMRFYSGKRDGGTHHHDLALVERSDLPAPPKEWSMFGAPCAVNHIAITMPNRESWLQHLSYLQKKEVKFIRRVEHGMTHSLYVQDPNGYGVEFVYDLPRNVWEGDIDAALNYSVHLPTDGDEALVDRVEGVPVFRNASTAAR